MDKKHTKRQHFVPRFLLKRFSFNGGEVYVFDRKSNKIFSANINTICYENDLYEEKWRNSNPVLGKYVLDNRLENYFTDVEGKASSLFKSVSERCLKKERQIILSKSEREILTEFVATLYLRNPANLYSIRDYYKGVEGEVQVRELIQMVDVLFEKLNWGSSESLIEFSKVSSMFNSDIDDSPLKVESERIIKLKYYYWYSPDNLFITSSFPMHIVSTDGERFDRIILPISPSLAIVLFYSQLPYTTEGLVLTPRYNDLLATMKIYTKTYPVEIARFFISNNMDYLSRLSWN